MSLTDLMDAPAYDPARDDRRRNIIIAIIVAVLLLGAIALAGYVSGHGWFFSNEGYEHEVNNFFSALEAKDYPKAYGIYYNDPQWQQHPDRYQDYPLDRFTEDFTTESNWKGPVTSFHVDYSRRNRSGVVVAATINGTTNLTLLVNRKDHTLAAYPYILTRGF